MCVLHQRKSRVYAGAGILGVAYAGAIRAEEAMGVPQPTRLAGTSAGAIVAAFRAVGVGGGRMQQLLSTDFRAFSRDAFGVLVELALDTRRLLRRYGLNSGKAMYTWLRDVLGNATFASIEPDLAVFALDIRTFQLTRYDRTSTPDVLLADAVSASSRFPFYFTPWRDGERLLVDGGVVKNFPLDTYPGLDTVGFRVEPSNTEPLKLEGDFLTFATRFVNGMVDAANGDMKADGAEIVELARLGVGTLDFGANSETLARVEQHAYDLTKGLCTHKK